jgi:pyruvate/2-oxoglutarate dehydrogenase complex dihydrolipoamide dehydrogenase (E3) component
MTEILKPDLCVIGAGAGGLSVAAAAAAFRVPVVLIESGRMGGDCLNYGCVPSKALLATARRLADIRDAAPLGIKAEAELDFAAVRRHVQSTIAELAPNDSAARFTGLGVRVIAGSARFTDRETVTVDDRFIIKARRFVIATGSTPTVPQFPGLTATPFLTNETIFDLPTLPRHLLIIGAGPVGVELAQAFRRFGSAVTVIEQATPLGRDDPECVSPVVTALEREGVVFRCGVKVVRVAGDAAGVAVTLSGGEAINGSHLLVAAGRTPAVQQLGLERSGIAVGPHGIAVDRRLRTTNKRIFAIGDVIGGPAFTHVANDHAGIVIRNALFRLPVRIGYDATPWVTFTDPELAQVGITEAQARKAGKPIRILRWPFHENDRARIERAAEGHIKVVVTPRGRILGTTIVGRDAGDLISIFTLAIAQGMNIRALAGFIVPYPTRAEVAKRAAMSHFTPGLTSPLVQRIIAALRRLG